MSEYKAQVEEPESREKAQESEPVWTYRGYRLRSSDFTTAMVHFFRAEIARANVWRMRLDTTTNWAVVSTGAVLSFAFSQPEGSNGIILLTALLITLFLYIEARRYRYYELWSYRVRLMETDFFAAMLVPPFQPDPDWAESLAENLLHPDFSVSMLEALGRRLRRNYLWIYAILGLAWLARGALIPSPVSTLEGLYVRLAVGPISGEAMLAGVMAAGGLILLVSLLTLGLHKSTGEVLPRYLSEPVFNLEAIKSGGQAKWFRQSRQRKQLMSLIITDQKHAVSEVVLQKMKRGVTALEGTGMYTGKAHQLLLVALTVTEVAHLKLLVSEVDPNAFVIVMPVQEVLGRGFAPLKTEAKTR